MFVTEPFTIDVVDILHLKKSIGNKKENIDIEIYNDYVQFSSICQLITPGRIRVYKDASKITNETMLDDELMNDIDSQTTTATTQQKVVVISGSTLNIISKLAPLVKRICIHKVTDAYYALGENWLRISCSLPHGNIVFYVLTLCL
jgi:hypothetical protein